MPVSRGLLRLLQVRSLEEEQHRRAVETATAELRALESAKTAAVAREVTGRELTRTSTHTGEVRDRQSGLVESHVGKQKARALELRIVGAEAEAARLRDAFLQKRMERRQAETLIEETRGRDAAEAARQGQKMLDEWYRSRPKDGLHNDEGPTISKKGSAYRQERDGYEIKSREDSSAIPSAGAKPKL